MSSIAMATGKYTSEKVTFSSHGETIVGKLFAPVSESKGTVVIMGPVAFIKEQVPYQYATRLALEGYTALIFDPRYHGESRRTSSL